MKDKDLENTNASIDSIQTGDSSTEYPQDTDSVDATTNADIYDALIIISDKINDTKPLTFIQEYGPIFPAFVIAVSGIIAVISLLYNNFIARRRATIDFIEAYESGTVYREANRCFRKRRLNSQSDSLDNEAPPSAGSLRELAGTSDPELLTDREHINNFLNHHELLAIGMNRGALDKKFYRAWMQGPVIRDWRAARPYVQRERWKLNEDQDEMVYKQDIWCQFEKLAIEWSDNEITKLTETDGQKPPVPAKGEAVPFSDRNSSLDDDADNEDCG